MLVTAVLIDYRVALIYVPPKGTTSYWFHKTNCSVSIGRESFLSETM
jgi:hypothetical protein